MWMNPSRLAPAVRDNGLLFLAKWAWTGYRSHERLQLIAE